MVSISPEEISPEEISDDFPESLSKESLKKTQVDGGEKRIASKQAKGKKVAPGKTTKLLLAMTGKASAAKAAEGDAPVFAYIASLPQPQRGIAERIDALAAKTLPRPQRSVKWGMAYYGVDGGWCFASGAFVGHVKLMFIRGTELKPEPPVTPIGMGKATRGVELAAEDELDERAVVAWMKQAAKIPFIGGKKAARTPAKEPPGSP